MRKTVHLEKKSSTSTDIGNVDNTGINIILYKSSSRIGILETDYMSIQKTLRYIRTNECYKGK